MWVQCVFGSVRCGFSAFLVVQYAGSARFGCCKIWVQCVFGSVMFGLSPFLVV